MNYQKQQSPKIELKPRHWILIAVAAFCIAALLPDNKKESTKNEENRDASISNVNSGETPVNKSIEPTKPVKKNQSKEDKEWQEVEEYNNKLLERADEVKTLRAKFEKDCFVSDYCMNLVLLIQNEMHDPKSFEMVETGYRVEDDHVIVVMKYRGTNAYGTKVLDAVKAKMDFNCEVKSIEYVR